MLIFATTVFLSAFLLFQVQPIVAKMILPWFGGSSSVWSVCMVFFQAELLLGYAYVHWLHARLALRRQLQVHAGLLLASLATLPVIADPSWKSMAADTPSLGVLMVLAATVGAPYLMLSTTGPLMQAWYARRSLGHTNAQPYRLYALSNLASMLALLSYPVVVEPFMAVAAQGWAWSMLYAGFVACCVATAWSMRGVPGAATASPANEAVRAGANRAPGWGDRLLWVGLAATASILLLAITRHLTQDVAPVPFLWVVPLSLYLLSFILCFDAPRYYARRWFLVALVPAFVAVDHVLRNGAGVPVMVALLCSALFVFCMVCHGELVRRKPDVQHLTLFYLMLSVGGALGGMLVGLAAPALFNGYHELPIGLLLCAALVCIVVWNELRRAWRWLMLAAVVAYGGWLAYQAVSQLQDYRVVMRNFYSQLRVQDVHREGFGTVRQLVHGRINHGEQALDAAHRGRATSYYCERSGVGQILNSLPQDRPRHIGIVGLGTGTLLTYGRAGDRIRAYEINDQVLDLARREFSFLGDTRAAVTSVLGDGRLMLEAEPPQGFDVLVMDAFSGDSIPTHLITLQAMRGYLRHLGSDGVLAVHISNKYLDLKPVMAAAAQQLGLVALLRDIDEEAGDPYCFGSTWVLLMSPGRAQALPPEIREARQLEPRAGFRAWTDDFSNLLTILK